MNRVIEKGNPLCKLLYKLLKEKYEYDSLLGISPYPELIKLKDSLDGINHCVAVVGKWVFSTNFPFGISLTQDMLDFCFINDNKKKERMVTKYY